MPRVRLGGSQGGRLGSRKGADGKPGSALAEIRARAAELFAERGYHASTMRALGERLGIAAPSLYNHYPEKQQILLDIAECTMRELLGGGLAAVEAHGEPEDQLRAFIAAHVRFHTQRRVEAIVADAELHALDPDNRARVIEVRDRYEALLRGILERGKDQAGWEVPDVPVIAFGIFTMATGVMSWFREGGRLSSEDVARIYTDFSLDALRAPTR